MQKRNETEKIWSAKRIFALPRMDTKNVCTIGLLIAVTIVLAAISGKIRIGNISKLSLSFVSVFVSGYLFGPITGGLVAAAADIISFLVNPTGAFLPQLTAVEFLYGFIYGFLFYKRGEKLYYFNVAVCDIVQFLVNMILKTFILSSIYLTPFNAMFLSRLFMCIVQFVIIGVVLVFIKPFLNAFFKKMRQ